MTVTTALTRGPTFSSRSRQTSANRTGYSLLNFTRAASWRTGMNMRSLSAMASSGSEGEVGFVAVRELHGAQAPAGREIAVEVGHDAAPLRFAEALGVARTQHFGQVPCLAAAVLR